MENPSITIRPASPGDGPAFRDLRLEALRLHPEAFSADLEMDEARSPEGWEERLGDGERTALFFAEHGSGKLVGMAGIQLGYSSKTRHGAEIFGVYVRPPWRGLGLAQAVLRACMEWAREHGASHLALGVEAGNVAAIRAYTRMGFVEYGLQPQALRVDGEYYDFRHMRLPLE